MGSQASITWTSLLVKRFTACSKPVQMTRNWPSRFFSMRKSITVRSSLGVMSAGSAIEAMALSFR